jgi:tRNA 2-selenouridine synthase
LSDSAALRRKLSHLRRHRGSAVVDRWYDLIDAGDRVALCRALAEEHYDPAYKKSMRVTAPRVHARLETDSLEREALERLADRVAAAVQTISM